MGLVPATYNMTYTPISALPFRMYNLIFNEWFRDQNLQQSRLVNKDDGPDDPTNYTLLKRGKRHDYFTSALPWPQKGPSVELPLGTTAPLLGTANVTTELLSGAATNPSAYSPLQFQRGLAGALGSLQATTGSVGSAVTIQSAGNPNESLKLVIPATGINTTLSDLTASGTADLTTGFADLTAATAATINQLREAFQIQRLYERDARGGTRYIEIIRSHFGVVSPDARLQRPEYLGGGTASVNINPVAQTSETTATTPQGNLAAFGTSIARRIGFQKSFVEHGYVIGLAAARADLSYQQGIDKMWMRQTRFDFYWPTLSHLGEQAVLNSEIFVSGTSVDQDVFGYQERYAEYRYKPSQILGSFSSNAAQPLDMWHLAQDFSALPALNASFIESNTPVERVIAVEDEPHFLWDGWFNFICARPMPTYSVPGLIDHF